MFKKKNGVHRRRRNGKLVRLAMKLVGEILVAAMLLVAIVAIEGLAGVAIHWVTDHVHNEVLTMLVGIVEDVVILADAVCYLWTVLVSVWSFIKEVR